MEQDPRRQVGNRCRWQNKPKVGEDHLNHDPEEKARRAWKQGHVQVS